MPRELTRRGKRIYMTNPSVTDVSWSLRSNTSRMKGADEGFVVSGKTTGEVLGEADLAIIQTREVDDETFVKVYLAGIKQVGQLGKAGLRLFEYVYYQLAGAAGRDRDIVAANLLLVNEWGGNMSAATYARGIGELLEKGFLFRSPTSDNYFINVNFLFNGHRLDLVNRYVRKQTVAPSRKPKTTEGQRQLALEDAE